MHREHMEIALRVLTATADRSEPAPADVSGLLRLAESAAERSMPLDELACAVIMRERRRAAQTSLESIIKARAAGN